MSTPAAKAQSRKLNIGCGWDKKDGFVNADLNAFHTPDVVADACDLAMFEDGSFDFILAQDILEHMERAKTVIALKEWSRLLSPDGHVDIRVPSLFGMFELLSKPENRAAEKAEQIIHLMYGTQAYNGDYHLAGFTAELLVEYLKRAGLVVRWAEVKDEWLFNLQVVKSGNIVTFEDIVHNAYFEVLGRPVDGGGLLGWVTLLKTISLYTTRHLWQRWWSKKVAARGLLTVRISRLLSDFQHEDPRRRRSMGGRGI